MASGTAAVGPKGAVGNGLADICGRYHVREGLGWVEQSILGDQRGIGGGETCEGMAADPDSGKVVDHGDFELVGAGSSRH